MQNSKIAILIPTYGRGYKLAKVAKNIHDNTEVSHHIYFIVESSDKDSQRAILEANEHYLINEQGHYAGAINTGYKGSCEPFILCAADDLDFKKNWDSLLLKVMEDKKICVTGAMDNWTISKSGVHVSHPLIRRTYIEEQSGCEDEENVIYSNKYLHIMCDIEMENVAIKRGVFKVCKEARIEHNHWFNGKAKKDETYERSSSCAEHDRQVYEERRKGFEQYLFEAAFEGKAVKVNKGLSIVLPTYNALAITKQTINSLLANTYNDIELIIVDDASDADTVAYLEGLSLNEKVKIKRFMQKKQQFVTKAWNMGIAKATREYVAVINNDITFSKNWDLYLMDALNQKNVLLANPYQTDDGYPEAYGKHERAGGIDIRGSCFMFKNGLFHEKIGFIPEELIMWFNDYWIAWKIVDKLKKKSVFVPEAKVHHYGSKSSIELQNRYNIFWWIVRGDTFAFEKMTGLDVSHWIELIGKKVWD